MPAPPDPTFGIFDVHVSHEGGTATLALAGELDLASVDTLREKLAKAKGNGASRIVLDLRELTFIDSSGISLLLSTIKEDDEGRLAFIPCGSLAVQRVLTLTGVAELFGCGAVPAGAESERRSPQPALGSGESG